MNRRIAKLAVFLLLGAVLNVAVAWVIWYRTPFEPMVIGMIFQENTIDDSRTLWRRNARKWWPQEPSHDHGIYRGVGIDVAALSNSVNAPAAGRTNIVRYSVWRTEIGWPRRIAAIEASYELHELLSAPFARFVSAEHNGWTIAGQPMPKAILWRGFAVNTSVYTFGWCVLILLPGIIRRSIRRKRGRCINCGYDLRGTSGVNSGGGGVCSECGAQSS